MPKDLKMVCKKNFRTDKDMLNSVILLVSALSGTMAKMPRGWPGVSYGKRDMGAGFVAMALN